MQKLLLFCTISFLAMSCTKEPWQIEMGSRLDSMIVLAKSHEQVISSTDAEQVAAAADVFGAHQIFFLEQLDEMAEKIGSYEALFSRRAMKYKSMGLKDKNLTETDYRNLILEEDTFLKRPVFLVGENIFVGNSKKTVEALISALDE